MFYFYDVCTEAEAFFKRKPTMGGRMNLQERNRGRGYEYFGRHISTDQEGSFAREGD